MQIETEQSACPACGATRLQIAPVFHHMLCAYIGPQYDFFPAPAGYTCPKCRRDIGPRNMACEIVGTSALCTACGREMIVSPPSRRAESAGGEQPDN